MPMRKKKVRLYDYQAYPVKDIQSWPLDEPLPYSVFNHQGERLYMKGYRFKHAQEREALAKMNPVRFETGDRMHHPGPQSFDRQSNPFAELDELGHRLDFLFRLIERKQVSDSEFVEKRFYEIATAIQGLCRFDADALLGAVHLNENFPYYIHHPLQIAILCEIIMHRLNFSQATRLSILGAALTSNIGMHHYQELLESQASKLSKVQQKMVSQHPEISARLLENMGVRCPLWLTLVRQHHERLDGSGYPYGLKGSQIRGETSLLALADIYSAMIIPKAYRPITDHKRSLQSTFLESGKSFDQRLAQVFFSELGLYPPGIHVRLANGESGVVIKRTDDAKAPVVSVIKRVDGNYYATPMRRDTRQPHYAIAYSYKSNERMTANPMILWGIQVIPLPLMAPIQLPDFF